MARKHSKFKNTGILFELLSRQVASEILSEKKPQAEKIIKEYFNQKTELNKELGLYRALMNDSFKTEREAREFVKTVLNERKKLDNKALRAEKYNLIKTINEQYQVDDFFKSRVNNYKLYASIFKLFESELGHQINPAELVSSKFTLIEYVCRKSKVNETTKNEVLEEYKRMDKDIRLLAYNMMIERFNDKYSNLNEKQKNLLSEYINNITNSSTLKHYINTESLKIQKKLDTLILSVEDDVVKIKLNEVKEQLPNYIQGQIVSDRHILVMMRYYELIKKLEKIK